uniref:Formin-like protein 2 n=1 Tax=Gouania willdenowi TaxID=441366 RepID=A0A8C5DC52_GOUWI
MGNTESMESQLAVIRSRAAPVRLPMPDPAELEERFSIALNSMNLPPDKVRLLRSYDNEKKWELICDQERFQVKNPPHTYIHKLRGFLDPAVTRKFRRRVQESTQTLRELEISLRTNHIGWVREFLNEENQGLDVLVEYLSFAQYAVTSTLVTRSNTLPSRRTLKNSRLVCKKDDVHVCVMCLRAIMNYQYGFNMVMSHPHAVNEIALSLNNRNPRTKALVLELLAAVCLVRGGHEIILSAFDHFKTVNNVFIVACMQFINIVVHSVEDMNFRVHLQYDFTKLNLDEHLERLKHTESDRLQVQIQAYLDNVFDVGTLLEDAETKTAALERVEELEENLGTVRQIGARQGGARQGGARQGGARQGASHHFSFNVCCSCSPETISYQNLGPALGGASSVLAPPPPPPPPPMPGTGKYQPIRTQQSFRWGGPSLCDPVCVFKVSNGLNPSPPPPAPPPPPPPPPPCRTSELSSAPLPPPLPPVAPPLPGSGGSPTVIFNSGLMFGTFSSRVSPHSDDAAVKIKKPIQTKFRMPVLNWVALKPSQINGTVFNDIDDEAILRDLDMGGFEELFKTKAQGPAVDLTLSRQKLPQKAPSKVSLLEANRSKNLAITLRKAAQSSEVICRAIHTFDLRTVRVDFVECLTRFLPTEAEVKMLRQYERDRKPLEALSDEDRFMMQFSRIERLSQRMSIMTFMGNFTDNLQMLTPQLHAIIAASVSIKSSQKLKKILEIILALGNYMNSSKRGAVYGFKLQSLDLLLETKSTDRKQTLLHYIANVIQEKYSSVLLFYNELHYVDKAAAVSLENVLCDVKELQRGMELTWREFSVSHNATLKDFISRNESRLSKLQEDAHIAQDAFEDAVKFFGESSKTMPPSVFFPIFVRFIKAYRVSHMTEPNTHCDHSPSHKGKRQPQELITELRRRQGKDSRHVYEGKDGAIEDIITGNHDDVVTVQSQGHRLSELFSDWLLFVPIIKKQRCTMMKTMNNSHV